MAGTIKLIEAIAKMEGFGAALTNIPTRLNNPGDIRAGQWANCHGAIPAGIDWQTGKVSAYAVFPNPLAGWMALEALLSAHYVGLTVFDAIQRYAPATDNNDTAKYVALVCKWTGKSPADVIEASDVLHPELHQPTEVAAA